MLNNIAKKYVGFQDHYEGYAARRNNVVVRAIRLEDTNDGGADRVEEK